MLKVSKMRGVFLVLVIIYVNISHAETKDYYKDVASSAILTNLEYFNVYFDCLTNSINQENCTEDGTHRDDIYIKQLDFVRTDLLNKYHFLYPFVEVHFKSENINDFRRKFIESVVLFQRKLLVFIGAVQDKCGTSDFSKTLNELNSWYGEYFSISNPLEYEKILKEYDHTIAKMLVEANAPCNKYLEINRKIYSEAFGNQFELAKKKYPKETLLSIFVDMYIIELQEIK